MTEINTPGKLKDVLTFVWGSAYILLPVVVGILLFQLWQSCELTSFQDEWDRTFAVYCRAQGWNPKHLTHEQESEAEAATKTSFLELGIEPPQ